MNIIYNIVFLGHTDVEHSCTLFSTFDKKIAIEKLKEFQNKYTNKGDGIRLFASKLNAEKRTKFLKLYLKIKP